MAYEANKPYDYDVVSVSRKGSEKKANYIQPAHQVGQVQQATGQFVRVFADMFLKHEASKKSYI